MMVKNLMGNIEGGKRWGGAVIQREVSKKGGKKAADK